MTVKPIISCKRAFAAWRSFNKRRCFKPRKKLNTNPDRLVLIGLENKKSRCERQARICFFAVFTGRGPASPENTQPGLRRELPQRPRASSRACVPARLKAAELPLPATRSTSASYLPTRSALRCRTLCLWQPGSCSTPSAPCRKGTPRCARRSYSLHWRACRSSDQCRRS